MNEHTTRSTIDSPAVSAGRREAMRRAMIAMRLAMPADVHRQASASALEHLTGLLLPRPAGTIGYCWPIRAEVDCRPLIEEMLARGWQASMPTVTVLNAPMEFRAWWPDAPLASDPFGIPVPATGASAAPDVLLLPLVAFDAGGYRLGYGGGYFDRTLAGCRPRPLTVGIGFECCAVATIYPEPHDVPLDVVITEAGMRRFMD